jgi:5-methyltetrahydropteroyltriglutamate--homocysteine methyltransferase
VEQAGDGFGGTGGAREERDFPEYFARRPHMDAFARMANASSRARLRTCCVGPIGWKDFSEVERDIANLKSAIQGFKRTVADVFMSATSPGNVLQKMPNRFYGTDEQYLEALCDALHGEYRAIVDAGLILQLDCPDLASRSGPPDYQLQDFRREVARNVEALNYATRDLPPERMRVHVCWGSDERPHHLDPELEDFVDLLLQARPAGLAIVAANGRHEHEWRVWDSVRLPEGKVLIPGVVDSTTNIIEHPETVAERILRFAGVVGAERMIAGVDCGFQTTAGRDQVDPKIAWAKLRSLVEGAQLASARLNGGMA